MDGRRVAEYILRILERHKQTIQRLPALQSQTLELAATVAAGEHYRAAGFTLDFVNPLAADAFVVKTSTRGHPSSFSHILARRDLIACEIHMNLMVRSAHDEGVYCVDVGVSLPGLVPSARKGPKWVCLENQDLITFVEAKKLLVYPMLLAQFLGIVHEIKPAFLRGTVSAAFLADGHFAPALVSLGRFSGNSERIVAAYQRRGIIVHIHPDFDERLSRMRHTEVFSFMPTNAADSHSEVAKTGSVGESTGSVSLGDLGANANGPA
jgi:hypothetical protein